MRLWTAIAATVLTTACQDRVPVRGSGASFPNPLYQAWALAYNRTGRDSMVDYQKKGSSAGIMDVTKGHVHFGASDAPMLAEERARAPDVIHLPTAAGPVAMVAHLDGHRPVLDGPTLCRIYRGSVRSWSAPAIQTLQAEGTPPLPDLPILPVRRADGSGTTYLFTSYLGRVCPEWAKEVGVGKAVPWPSGTLGGKGNDGVAQVVQQTPGALGYVELKFAEAAGFEPLPLRN